ncbi:MAG: hypothetical protein M1837_004817 [Sclerophora amabilis]|nr:MAG: hypothetical protein M1837_004817 [Sclerophora amabilis]
MDPPSQNTAPGEVLTKDLLHSASHTISTFPKSTIHSTIKHVEHLSPDPMVVDDTVPLQMKKHGLNEESDVGQKRLKVASSSPAPLPTTEPTSSSSSATPLLWFNSFLANDASYQANTSGPPKKKRAGRPRKLPPKPKKAHGPTRLRKGRGVVSEVPIDVWHAILSHCPARFLAKARRINHEFKHILSYESAWTRNRLQNHGDDTPGPLEGMREDEHANLIEGLGCMDCGNPKTRKPYWVWQKRWCLECWGKNTIKEDAAKILVGENLALLDNCVPYGLVDAWGRYEVAGFYEKDWSRKSRQRQRVFSKAAVSQAIVEFQEFCALGPDGKEKTDKEIEGWYGEKSRVTQHRMKHIQQIEKWYEESCRQGQSCNRQLKSQRAEFFKERALTLDPPLESEALALIPAYQRAISIGKPPTERAWKMLLPKLKKDRASAQVDIEERRSLQTDPDQESKEAEYYCQMLRERDVDDAAERRALEICADQVLDDMEESSASLANADFGLLALTDIRCKYYENPDATWLAGHPLLLSDAKWVWERIVYPKLCEREGTRKKTLVSFKCPGCIRTDVHVRYSFENLFNHLTKKHVSALGEFKFLYRRENPLLPQVQWLNIGWPRKLPMLAEHHKATGTWDPDDASPYSQAPPPPDTHEADKILEEIEFDGRMVSAIGPNMGSFVDSVIFAGSNLRDVQLDPKLKTLVALTFAMDKHTELYADFPGIKEIKQLPLALIREGMYDLFDKLRCGICSKDRDSHARSGDKVHSLATLIEHFEHAHYWKDVYVDDMMVLPGLGELWFTLTRPGNEAAYATVDEFFPRRGADSHLNSAQRHIYSQIGLGWPSEDSDG